MKSFNYYGSETIFILSFARINPLAAKFVYLTTSAECTGSISLSTAVKELMDNLISQDVTPNKNGGCEKTGK